MLALVPDVGLRTLHYAEERSLHAAEPVEKHEAHEDTKAHPKQHEKGKGKEEKFRAF